MTLSETQGTMPEKVVLPGNLTGRDHDRIFACVPRSSMPTKQENEQWKNYLYKAVDHIDFKEIKNGQE